MRNLGEPEECAKETSRREFLKRTGLVAGSFILMGASTGAGKRLVQLETASSAETADKKGGPAMEEKERGSEKLLKKQLGTRTFKEADLERFINKIAGQKIELTDYFPKGIPFPDVLHGSIKTNPKDLGNVIRDLLGHEGIRFNRITVFPKGIPNPREVNVDFEAVPNIAPDLMPG